MLADMSVSMIRCSLLVRNRNGQGHEYNGHYADRRIMSVVRSGIPQVASAESKDKVQCVYFSHGKTRIWSIGKVRRSTNHYA